MALLLPSLALGAGPAVADPNPPPPVGGIDTGSSTPAGTTGSSGPVGAPLGTGSSRPLRLGPAVSHSVPPEIPLRLSPGGPYTPSAAAAATPGGTLGNSLGLSTGSVQTACVGSAVVGGAGLLLGLLTGSGVITFGSSGSALGSVLGSSGVGWGSSGSALGSAAVGSAATDSALLTCLLLLPAPPAVPEIPLRIPPLPQIVQVRIPAPVPAPARPAPRIPRPRARYVPPVVPVAQAKPPVAWNVLELMTVMVVSVVAGVRVKAARRGSRG